MDDLANAAGLAIEPYDYQRGLAKLMQHLGLRPDDAGARIGRYRLLALVGTGAFGRVYRGWDLELDRVVALKLISVSNRDAKATRHAVRAEARALAALAHPGIVSVFDILSAKPAGAAATVDATDIVIVMEFVEGVTLREWAERSKPSLLEIAEAFSQAAAALGAAHDHGIVHRDFKPTNAMRRPDGRIAVLDFGVATALAGPETLEQQASGDSILSKAESVRGVVGTPLYMAPEQLKGGEASAASDIYALGVSLYEAAYGQLPFGGGELERQAMAKLEGPPRPPASRRDVPRWFREAVLRALSPNPRDRWPSMHAFIDALRPPRRRRGFPLLVGASVVAIVAVAASVPSDPAVACAKQATRLPAAWREAIPSARAVHERLELAPEEIDMIEDRMHAYTADWEARYKDACGDLSDDGASDRRQFCLDAVGAAVQAQLRAHASAGRPAALPWELLPDLRECDDAELARRDPLPIDPAQRAQIQEISEWATRFDQKPLSEDELLAHVQRARAIGHRPTLARILAVGGRWHRNARRNEEMKSYFDEAYEVALEGGADRTALHVSVDLIIGAPSAAEANRWAQAAIALADQLAGSERDRTRAYTYLAMMQKFSGENKDAFASIEIAANDAMTWPDRDWWGSVILVRALEYSVQQNATKKAAVYAAEVERRFSANGFEDAKLKLDGALQLALFSRFSGDLAQAEARLRPYVDDPPANPEARWLMRLNLIEVLGEAGRVDEAVELLEAVPPNQSDARRQRGQWHLVQGRLLTRLCRLGEAREALNQARLALETLLVAGSVELRLYDERTAELEQAEDGCGATGGPKEENPATPSSVAE